MAKCECLIITSNTNACLSMQVLALGLLEDPQNKRAIGLARRAEALHRFLLSQLDKEAKDPVLPPVPASAPPSKVCYEI